MKLLTPRSCCLQDFQCCVVFPATEGKDVCAQVYNWKALSKGAKPFPLRAVKTPDGRLLMLDPKAPQNEAFRIPAMEAAKGAIDSFLRVAKCKRDRAIVSSDGQPEPGSSTRNRKKTTFFSPEDRTRDRGNNGNGGVSSAASESQQDAKPIVSSKQIESVAKTVTATVAETVTATVTATVLEAVDKALEKAGRKTAHADTKRLQDDSEKQELMRQVQQEKDKLFTLMEQKNKELVDYLKEDKKNYVASAKDDRADTMQFALHMVSMFTNNPCQGMKRKEPTPAVSSGHQQAE